MAICSSSPLAIEIDQYNGRLTSLVLLSCMVATMGGVIFGYDLGISGRYITHSLSLDILSDYKSVRVIIQLFPRWSGIDGAILEEVLSENVGKNEDGYS